MIPFNKQVIAAGTINKCQVQSAIVYHFFKMILYFILYYPTERIVDHTKQKQEF